MIRKVTAIYQNETGKRVQETRTTLHLFGHKLLLGKNTKHRARVVYHLQPLMTQPGWMAKASIIHNTTSKKSCRLGSLSLRALPVILAVIAMNLTGCGFQNTLKHTQSSLIGLDRKITLFDSDGKPIKSWQTRAKIEDNGGTIYFIANGKAVTISGTFIVEEE